MNRWIRVWYEKDIAEIEQHLMMIGDLKGDCAQCRELNLDYKQVRQCPKCGTVFHYITSRRLESHPAERFQIVKRTNEIRPDLVCIDYEDYKKLTGRQKARDFFSDAH